MKKIIGILSVFLAGGFLVCFIIGLCQPIPKAVPQGFSFLYKFCTGMESFFKVLPAILLTGFVVSFSVYFGRNPEGSMRRFSQAMMKRFKYVLISGLICTFLLAFTNEILSLSVRRTKANIINRPKILNEYLKLGNEFYESGDYDRAIIYANAILSLDSSSQAAQNLKTKADYERNKEYSENLHFELNDNEHLFEETEEIDINPEQISNTYSFYLSAKEAFEKEQWFNAHYFAEQGVSICSPKDPNLSSLKDIAAQAWNNLTEEYVIARSAEETYFQEKYRGYLALMEKDDLQAYYIFRYLFESNQANQRDPDLTFYFDIAKERISKKYFFVDETFELKAFENVNDIHFVYRHIDGTNDLVYFKGMTSVKATGQSVQYLRDLYIVTIDKNGNWTRTMHTPYAKVMPVSVSNINPAAKVMLEIAPETDKVPYFMLKSIGRDNPEEIYTPEYLYENGDTATTPEYLLFPLDYDDFLMLEQTPSEPQLVSLVPLLKLFKNASDYGYSPVVFGQILLDRTLYPIFILLVFIMLAMLAWDYRINSNSYFKFSWVFSFPFMMALAFIVYEILLYGFKLINYYLLVSVGGMSALAVGAVVYLVLFLISSLGFISKKA